RRLFFSPLSPLPPNPPSPRPFFSPLSLFFSLCSGTLHLQDPSSLLSHSSFPSARGRPMDAVHLLGDGDGEAMRTRSGRGGCARRGGCDEDEIWARRLREARRRGRHLNGSRPTRKDLHGGKERR
ncbi:unnamed protein product, partial [Linum tenue]